MPRRLALWKLPKLYCIVYHETRGGVDLVKNQTEDELHFIVACPLYDDIRSGTLYYGNKFSSNESSILNFVKLFCSNEKHTLVQLGNFIVKAFTLRTNSFQ